MNRFCTILFDLDGTLMDHFGAIHASHAYTLKHLGLPAPTMAQVRKAVGGGFEAAVKRILGPEHQDLLPRALEIYRTAWEQNIFNGVMLLPGARALLIELKKRNIRTAVFTNKHGPSARSVCQHVGIDTLVDGVFGAFDTPWLKPQAEFTAHVLKALRGERETTCLIGDSTYDIEAATNGGIPCYCVTTGTHDADHLASANSAGVFDDLFDLSREVLGITLPVEN